MKDNYGIGERIFAIRRKLKLSQQEVADKVGVSRPSLSQMETGTIAVSLHAIMKFVSLFNTTYEWLLTGKGDMFASEEERLEHLDPKILQEKINYLEQLLKTKEELIRAKDAQISLLMEKLEQK